MKNFVKRKPYGGQRKINPSRSGVADSPYLQANITFFSSASSLGSRAISNSLLIISKKAHQLHSREFYLYQSV